MKIKDFSKIPIKSLNKLVLLVLGFAVFVLVLFLFEIYVPLNPSSGEAVKYSVPKGAGDKDIADDLKASGIIRSSYFFKVYLVLSLKHSGLQAGEYNLSPKMSIYEIARKMFRGDIIQDKIVILEGWDLHDISVYMEKKEICSADYFASVAGKDYSAYFDFLKDRPKKASLEGYLFPDTYQISRAETCEDIIAGMLYNFGKKLSPEIREEIARQKKSIFEIVTMASLIEKEVRNMEDKKIVSGILWKRLEIGMPLQLDATVNYITGKSDPSVAIKDTKIDSLYNTYMYAGLPKGPIANPGINSLLAALYPTKTDYLYYLSNGKTFFSRTYEEHLAAKRKHLGT